MPWSPGGDVAVALRVTALGRARRMLPVLREEDILEVGLAADHVDDPVRRGDRDERPDRAADAHRDDVARRVDVADARQALEDRRRDRRSEGQLDMMERKLPDRLDPIDLDEPALADDGHALAGPIDL